MNIEIRITNERVHCCKRCKSTMLRSFGNSIRVDNLMYFDEKEMPKMFYLKISARFNLPMKTFKFLLPVALCSFALFLFFL